MPLLIDGYNLLNASGIFGVRGPRSLESSRRQLLTFLTRVVTPQELASTAVVFDGRQAPPGLLRRMEFQGMTIYFAPRTQEADDLLEQLIQEHPTPRKLVVVSSDHRVQRAAKRRRARAVDSDVWYAEVRRQRRQTQDAPQVDKPIPPLDDDWAEFYEPLDGENESPNTPDSSDEFYNPFPDGYADDLLDGENGPSNP